MSVSAKAEHLDVVIVGAGVSGIGTACHLRAEHPGRSFAILEARDAIGGTWDLFRYPGIRSDSDLQTFGYAFKPWTGEKTIADGPDILRYVRETAREHDVERHIRFHHRVERAEFSTEQARWTVHVRRTDTGEATTLTCAWLFSAGGYYSYDAPFDPGLPGTERFAGRIVHPQSWPEDLDYAGKRVVVIGSGATAVTIAPAMARTAGHVTMLQRSPSYILTLPSEDRIANGLRRLLGDRRGYALARRKNIRMQAWSYAFARRRPRLARAVIRALAKRQLPEGYPVDVHFRPRYDPWDQRLCVVPDGDLFRAIRKGRMTLVTDRIETFTERGLRLASGAELEADVVITATGLALQAFGGVRLSVDGEEVRLPDKLAYKGVMLSDVPNFAFAVGYINASWTLKVDIAARYLCRLLAHMDATGQDIAVPHNDDPDLRTRPLLDFKANYVQRSVDQFPRQGDRGPWEQSMRYAHDARVLLSEPVDDGVMRFARGGARIAPTADLAAA